MSLMGGMAKKSPFNVLARPLKPPPPPVISITTTGATSLIPPTLDFMSNISVSGIRLPVFSNFVSISSADASKRSYTFSIKLKLYSGLDLMVSMVPLNSPISKPSISVETGFSSGISARIPLTLNSRRPCTSFPYPKRSSSILNSAPGSRENSAFPRKPRSPFILITASSSCTFVPGISIAITAELAEESIFARRPSSLGSMERPFFPALF